MLDNETRVRSVAITGVTVSGNMGGTAMLLATMDSLRKRWPAAEFVLLSVTPGADRALPAVPGLKIVSAHYLWLVLVYLPLSALLWPFRRFLPLGTLLSHIPYFKALARADAVVDLAGIAFVDGRGPAVLAYNTACCLPAMLLDRPVFKLAQALGPFDTWPNRVLARFILGRCRAVVARGQVSKLRLHELGITAAHCLPDVSFALEIRPADHAAARQRFAQSGLRPPSIILSPSEVVRRLLPKDGQPFEDDFAALIRKLRARGYSVALLPHGLSSGSSRNNDVDLCREIARRVEPADPPPVIEGIADPRVLRAIIGQADIFIGSRFHAVVAALSMGVPSIVIGWGHKYREMAEGMLPVRWILDVRDFSVDRVLAGVDAMVTEHAEIARTIELGLQQVKADVDRNFDLVVEAIDDR